MEYRRMAKLVEYQLEDSKWCWMKFGINWMELHSRARDDLFIRIEPYDDNMIAVSVLSSETGEGSGQAASSVREALDILNLYIEVLKFKEVRA